jgi:hypothetical protein
MKTTTKRSILSVGGITGALVVFLLMTDPYKLPLILLTVPFLLLTALIYLVCRAVLGKLIGRKGKTHYTAGVMTGLLMLIILLQTIRQLSIRDFLIVGALFVGLSFYMRRIDL